jgi:hypothetical protein
MENPFEILNEKLDRIESQLMSIQEKQKSCQIPEHIEYLKSIKEMSDFLGCSDVTSQRIKNQNAEIFLSVGCRKFMVSKTDLLSIFKNRKKEERNI